jgi:Phosphorylase superfamily
MLLSPPNSAPAVQTILVPQGAEYQAVVRGLNRTTGSRPQVLAIPVGPTSVLRHLAKLQQDGLLSLEQPGVLVMGLCGSLTPRYAVGDVVIYRECVDRSPLIPVPFQSCDSGVNNWIRDRLQEKAAWVRALTSDRLVWSQQEKHQLAQQYQAEVVDMEGFPVLEVLGQTGFSVAILRVVSDNAQHDIPDLTSAISPEGNLQPFPLAIGMLRQPLAASRLVWGSLRSLQVLQGITTTLFSQSASILGGAIPYP